MPGAGQAPLPNRTTGMGCCPFRASRPHTPSLRDFRLTDASGRAPPGPEHDTVVARFGWSSVLRTGIWLKGEREHDTTSSRSATSAPDSASPWSRASPPQPCRTASAGSPSATRETGCAARSARSPPTTQAPLPRRWSAPCKTRPRKALKDSSARLADQADTRIANQA